MTSLRSTAALLVPFAICTLFGCADEVQADDDDSADGSSGSGGSGAHSGAGGTGAEGSGGTGGDGGAPSNLPCGADAAVCASDLCSPDQCIQPSHTTGFGAIADQMKSESPTALVGNAIFSTSSGEVAGFRMPNDDPDAFEVHDGIGFVRQAQPGNEPAVAIWVFAGLEHSSGIVTATGEASVILASTKDLDVSATTVVDVSAKGTTPGPGGYFGGIVSVSGAGCGGGKGSDSSGGGAGYGTSGADGGGFASSGGLSSVCAPAYGTLALLGGGSGGGGGEHSNSRAGLMGGGGGGAVQLFALGTLRMAGVVTSAGGGANAPDGNWRSGSGGGSGGAILLEAPGVQLSAGAGLYTNGGAGSSSSYCVANGEDGKAGLTPAVGGACSGSGGGNGAAGSTAATIGEGSGGGAGSAAGGGGGGLGRIVIRTIAGHPPDLTGVELSPPENTEGFAIVDDLSGG